jgi:hypothetical protein
VVVTTITSGVLALRHLGGAGTFVKGGRERQDMSRII